jgi:hypothetical protein
MSKGCNRKKYNKICDRARTFMELDKNGGIEIYATDLTNKGSP